MRALWFGALLASVAATAQAGVIAARDLPAGTLLSAGDLALDESVAGGVSLPQEAIGLENRVAIYRGRPVSRHVLQPPVLVRRNQTVRVAYRIGGLVIEAEARALAAGAEGDVIRALNTSSRKTVLARIAADGALHAITNGVSP